MTTSYPPLRLFVSFAPEDGPLWELLLNHLAPLVNKGVFSVWSRASLRGGEDIERCLDAELASAQVLVPLISSHYLSSSHLQDIARVSHRQCPVIPILLRPCIYDDEPALQGRTVLPHHGTEQAYPIVRNANTLHDEPLAKVAAQLKEAVRQLHEESLRQLHGSISSGPTVRHSLPVEGAGATSGPWSSGAYVLVPPAPSRPAKKSRPVLSWGVAALALLASIAVVVLLVKDNRPPANSLSSHPLPTGASTEPPRSTAAAPPAEEPRCCGGVDCKPPAKDIRKTYCEKVRGQCGDCGSAGRRYIGGSCNAPLARDRAFLLRVAYANHRDPKVDEVCFRLSGTPSYTCASATPKSPASVMDSRILLRVADISGTGRGIDIELRNNGSPVATRGAATIDALSAAMLCVGLSFPVETGTAVFYLDDP